MTTPCVPSVLSRNPQFAALHQHLTTKILNPDGSSQTLDPSSRAVHNVPTPPAVSSISSCIYCHRKILTSPGPPEISCSSPADAVDTESDYTTCKRAGQWFVGRRTASSWSMIALLLLTPHALPDPRTPRDSVHILSPAGHYR